MIDHWHHLGDHVLWTLVYLAALIGDPPFLQHREDVSLDVSKLALVIVHPWRRRQPRAYSVRLAVDLPVALDIQFLFLSYVDVDLREGWWHYLVVCNAVAGQRLQSIVLNRLVLRLVLLNGCQKVDHRER